MKTKPTTEKELEPICLNHHEQAELNTLGATVLIRQVDPKPDIDTSGYDHLHWSMNQDAKGKPRNPLHDGTTGPCTENIGAFGYLGRSRSGYHRTIYGPIWCPFGGIGDSPKDATSLVIKGITIRRWNNRWCWFVAVKSVSRREP